MIHVFAVAFTHGVAKVDVPSLQFRFWNAHRARDFRRRQPPAFVHDEQRCLLQPLAVILLLIEPVELVLRLPGQVVSHLLAGTLGGRVKLLWIVFIVDETDNQTLIVEVVVLNALLLIVRSRVTVLSHPFNLK